MSYCLMHERSLFGFEEFAPILRTHHPFVAELEGAELPELRSELRRMRDRERTLARKKRRQARGKGAVRGLSFPGTAEHPLKRKQVISAALKRLNSEIAQRARVEARAQNVESARRALAVRRSAQFRHHPSAEEFRKSDRMRSLPSRKRRPVVHGARIGSISQANKAAQAARDARG